MKRADGVPPQGTVQIETTGRPESFIDHIRDDLTQEFGDETLYFDFNLEHIAPGAPTGEYMVIAIQSAATGAGAVLAKKVYEYVLEEYVKNDHPDKPGIHIDHVEINIDNSVEYHEQLPRWIQHNMEKSSGNEQSETADYEEED